eukprot:TRINITY_DN3999_c0_g1_i1.p1 TRINITY_DN3999_c0_g1~~TRINITY_DN3999_c0_g1_i1.p1  ORF type:complete len:210 (-),score=62.64 TRINITY_DN3999_c0_g1_i1:250-858(-)
MIRRPPRSTHCISSAASDVYKRQPMNCNKKIFNEVKDTQRANEGDSGKRWEEEADRIMRMVKEHQVREVAETRAQRNGLVKRSLTPKITERNASEEMPDSQGESCEESIFVGVGQSKGTAIAKAELAKEYEQVIKQTREKRAYEMDIERRNDQERLESVMRDHQRKLAIIAEMKKVPLHVIILGKCGKAGKDTKIADGCKSY